MAEPYSNGSGVSNEAGSWLAAAFLQAPVGMAVLAPDGSFVEVNEALCDLLGRDREELRSTMLDDVTVPEDVADLRSVRERLLAVGGSAWHRGRYRLVPASGSPVAVSLSAAVLEQPEGQVQGLVLHAEDVTEVLQREVELAHLALHDPLTGLANRVLFLDRLEHALGRLRREPSSVGLLFLDVDNFKLVNDRYGHEEGDRVLAETARRLSGAVRPGDTVARYGGDEFVVLCEGAGAIEANAVSRRVAERFEEPIRVSSGDLITLRSSVGVAVTESVDTAPEELLREADAAMYREKARRSSP